MIKVAAVRPVLFAWSAVLACALAGCGAPNISSGSGTSGIGGAGTGATGSTGTSVTNAGQTAFGAGPGTPNHQNVATPNSALVVTLSQSLADPMPVSPSGGFPISVTETLTGPDRGARVNLAANLANTKSINTAGMEQPIAPSGTPDFQTNYYNSVSSLVVHTSVADDTVVLSDAKFGILYLRDPATRHGAWAPFHIGQATPLTQGPTTASATYTGTFVGQELRGPNNDPLIIGYSAPVTLTADFAAGTVSGSVATTPFGQIGLAFDGTITGNAYQGTARLTGSPSVNPVTTTSALSGAFYGSGAAETAGAIVAQGRQNFTTSQNSPVTVVGSFGAKR